MYFKSVYARTIKLLFSTFFHKNIHSSAPCGFHVTVCTMDSSISIHGICFSDHEACGVSASQPGMEPAPLAFEGEVLTTGLPGKSPELFSESQFTCLNSRRDAS